MFAFVSDAFKKLDLHKKLSFPPYAETDMMTPPTSFPLIVIEVLFCLFASTEMISLLNAILEKPISSNFKFNNEKERTEALSHNLIRYLNTIRQWIYRMFLHIHPVSFPLGKFLFHCHIAMSKNYCSCQLIRCTLLSRSQLLFVMPPV